MMKTNIIQQNHSISYIGFLLLSIISLVSLRKIKKIENKRLEMKETIAEFHGKI
ncbi:LPXTG cell wall anchor domain-containing protein [Cytobacillus sp. Hm23]